MTKDQWGWPVNDDGYLSDDHDSHEDAQAAKRQAEGMTADEAAQFAERLTFGVFVATTEPVGCGTYAVRFHSTDDPDARGDLVFRKKAAVARYLNDLGQSPLTLRGHTEPEWGGLGPQSWGRL